MFIINADNSIKLTRGDTARFNVPLKLESGEEYAMQPGDTLTFSMKKSKSDTEYAVRKVVTGTNEFHLEPKDTKGLNFGKHKYDVELTTESGDNYTVISYCTFTIAEEV